MLTDYLSNSAVAEIADSIADVFGVSLAIANLDGTFLFVPANWTLKRYMQAPEFVKYLLKMSVGGDRQVVNAGPDQPLAVIPLEFAGKDCAYGIIDLAGVNCLNEDETKKFLESITKSLKDLSIYKIWAKNKQISDVKFEVRQKVKEFQHGRVSHKYVVKQILDSLISLSLADLALIALVDDKGESLETKYVAGDATLIPECLNQCSLALWTLHVKDPIVIDDPTSDPRCKKEVLENQVKRIGVWPLFFRDKTFGILYIACRKLQSEQREQEYIDDISLNVSFVLEAKYRKSQTSDITRKINAFNEIGKILNSSLDLSEVLDLMANMSMNLFNCGICCVYLQDTHSSATELMVARGVTNEEIKSLVYRFHPNSDKTANIYLLDFPIRVKDKEIGYLSMGRFPSGKPSAEDRELIQTFTYMAGIAVENSRMYEETKIALLETITVLSLAIEARDKTMFGHSEKVREIAVAMAEFMELPENEISVIESAGLLHDIGKLGIPEPLLNKSGSLTAQEYEEFKKHPVVGADILKAVTSFGVIGNIVRHHHERYDGQGYPDGLRGEEIPLGSRILAIADTFASLVSKRSYRSAKDPFEALELVMSNAGTQFDPNLVVIFEKIIRQRYSFKIKFNRSEGSVISSEPNLAASELGLTEREAEILGYISSGLNNKEIADILFLSEKTVKTHVTHILRKLNLPDRTKAAIFAIQKGLTPKI